MAPKGRKPKKQKQKQKPRSADGRFVSLREISRARPFDVSRSGAAAGAAGESGVVEGANAMAGSNKSLIRGLDECLDEGCAGGGGSSAAVAELVGNAECAEISGEVQVRARISGFDESSEAFFDDLAGVSSVALPAAGVAGESGVAEDAKAMAGSNRSLIRGLDECLDEGCAGGGGSSAAVAELVGNAECAEISGYVQVRARISGFDESSEEFFDDLAGGSSAAISGYVQVRARISGFDESSEEFFDDLAGGSSAALPAQA
jgi:NifU-like protein involved in Fe-S cluster formation